MSGMVHMQQFVHIYGNTELANHAYTLVMLLACVATYLHVGLGELSSTLCTWYCCTWSSCTC
jgi:hypothetical protein